mmetsp:Transcript_28881/g.73234  ORF Transcript_28881/g.73234 Transcript_28881/m.73234 type:complete len:271 (-) Transcript_28881:173-985(-)
MGGGVRRAGLARRRPRDLLPARAGPGPRRPGPRHLHLDPGDLRLLRQERPDQHGRVRVVGPLDRGPDACHAGHLQVGLRLRDRRPAAAPLGPGRQRGHAHVAPPEDARLPDRRVGPAAGGRGAPSTAAAGGRGDQATTNTAQDRDCEPGGEPRPGRPRRRQQLGVEAESADLRHAHGAGGPRARRAVPRALPGSLQLLRQRRRRGSEQGRHPRARRDAAVLHRLPPRPAHRLEARGAPRLPRRRVPGGARGAAGGERRRQRREPGHQRGA